MTVSHLNCEIRRSAEQVKPSLLLLSFQDLNSSWRLTAYINPCQQFSTPPTAQAQAHHPGTSTPPPTAQAQAHLPRISTPTHSTPRTSCQHTSLVPPAAQPALGPSAQVQCLRLQKFKFELNRQMYKDATTHIIHHPLVNTPYLPSLLLLHSQQMQICKCARSSLN